MELLPPTSIFRCMPSILPLNLRRLLGAFAYAFDGAELSFARLRETAAQYVLPTPGMKPSPAQWHARNRLSIIVDAWAFIDHVSRVRKLVKRFPWDTPEPPIEVKDFLASTRSADIRNRLHHLDEDIFEGKNCVEGHPILGSVSWVDTRTPGGHTRFSISSGPTIDAGNWGGFRTDPITSSEPVCQFRLVASDREAALDELQAAARAFAQLLETSVRQSVDRAIVAEAPKRGKPPEQLCGSGVADMTMAFRLEPGDDENSGRIIPEQCHALVEVPPHTYKLGTNAH